VNTLLEPIENLKNTLPYRDAVFVGSQTQRWTVRELDVYNQILLIKN
jgi:hypothetical protein